MASVVFETVEEVRNEVAKILEDLGYFMSADRINYDGLSLPDFQYRCHKSEVYIMLTTTRAKLYVYFLPIKQASAVNKEAIHLIFRKRMIQADWSEKIFAIEFLHSRVFSKMES